jgi:uncharacterized protein
MALSKILVDSSFLYALYARDDKDAEEASAVADLYSGQFVIPYVVLTEAAFLFNRTGGIPALVQFLDALVKADYEYEIISNDDLIRIREIMATYRDAKLDFVDCCVMALSERLNITQVCTLDHRDFSIFRPKYGDYLEILP